MKLAGVVTLYHPGEGVEENIRSYLGEQDALYVCDIRKPRLCTPGEGCLLGYTEKISSLVLWFCE